MVDAPTAPPPSAPAPSAAPAPAPAPVANEAVVNPNPVNSSNPVGDQAPPRTEARPNSRREAIQAAFERANNPTKAKPRTAPAPAKPAAEAKVGHNQPPEETPAEPPINLKRRPDDQQPPQTQPRGERGQFAPRQQNPSEVGAPPQGSEQPLRGQPAIQSQQGQPPRPAHRPLPANAPYREPPQRMAEHAKADWAAVPDSVRGEVHRMHQEFGNAYQQYRGAYEAMQPIKKFHDMARQHGTTLEKALTNYTSMEQKLRSDLVGGLDVIVNNLGLKGPNGEKISLRDVAYHVLSQSPEQLRQVQQGNQQQAAAQQIGALHQQIENLRNALGQMQHQQQFAYTRSQVDAFADDGRHPRFDELADLIHNEIQLGFDIETAYARADRLRPASPRAAQTRDLPPAQTRTVDRSISGAPDASASNAASQQRNPKKQVGRREAIANAVRRANGAV